MESNNEILTSKVVRLLNETIDEAVRIERHRCVDIVLAGRDLPHETIVERLMRNKKLEVPKPEAPKKGNIFLSLAHAVVKEGLDMRDVAQELSKAAFALVREGLGPSYSDSAIFSEMCFLAEQE